MIVEWLSEGLAKKIFIEYIRLYKCELSLLQVWNSVNTF